MRTWSAASVGFCAIVTLILLNGVFSESFCAVSRKYLLESRNDENFTCDRKPMTRGSDKAVLDQANHCNRLYLLDLSEEFTNDQQFQDLRLFLGDSIKTCFGKKIGETIHIRPFGDTVNKLGECCSEENCNSIIWGSSKSDFFTPYAKDDAVFNNDTNFVRNYSNTFIYDMKYLNPYRCNPNSFVMITNRIVDLKQIPSTLSEIANLVYYVCAEFSIILVGRPEATMEQLRTSYGNLTENLFVVPDYNCLSQLTDCLSPCNSTSYEECTRRNFTSCSPMTTPFPTTTPTPTTTTEKYPDSWHLLYTFALSSNTTDRTFNAVIHNLVPPIGDFINKKGNVSVAFILSEDLVSPWFTAPEEILDYLKVVKTTDTIIEGAELDDADDQHTVGRLNATMLLKPVTGDETANPRITLVTDFMSENFLKFYMDSDWGAKFGRYEFFVYALGQDSYMEYNHTTIHNVVYVNPEHPQPVPLIDDPYKNPNSGDGDKISEKTVIIIIVGAISGVIILLCAGTIIYRQKMVWKTKLENIRASHHKREEQPTDIHIDYWELTWDKLLVKSEKLGSGAYGQVLRGKLMGKPPCVDHFYQNLQLRNVSSMENADVAIKMLPKFADEAAKKEFMNEIELMKLIGYHDNIVNMLGCITVGHPVCLVLEFCPHRDLLQYVKARKVEVTISNSLEEKINHTKDFLIFAWQIAHGMKYLAGKGIIHRDLAARNVLIDAEHNAKISDFGLCLQTADKTVTVSQAIFTSTSGRLPIKWLAIESLQKHEFSLKSDIWAFGILLFEMYSFGEVPFAKIEPKNLPMYLENGNRPEKPELCTQETYDIMLKCWQAKPEERPSFEELLTLFTVFLERSTEGYGYLPLLKFEETKNTNDIGQRLAQDINPTCDTPPPPNTFRNRLMSSESNAIFNMIRRWSTASAKSSNSNLTRPGSTAKSDARKSWLTRYYENTPDVDIEQGRKRSASDMTADSIHTGDLDPGVEMRNGRPRLRNQHLDNAVESNNSSLRKSSTFHGNDASRPPIVQRRASKSDAVNKKKKFQFQFLNLRTKN